MHIIAIAWIYVVALMSLTEHSVVAGIMTFLIYCVLPLTIILYIGGSSKRKQRRKKAAQEVIGVSKESSREQSEGESAGGTKAQLDESGQQ
ncbi:MAG: hypothetical protein V4805_03290 [Pseudomonadota bacterium]